MVLGRWSQEIISFVGLSVICDVLNRQGFILKRKSVILFGHETINNFLYLFSYANVAQLVEQRHGKSH